MPNGMEEKNMNIKNCKRDLKGHVIVNGQCISFNIARNGEITHIKNGQYAKIVEDFLNTEDLKPQTLKEKCETVNKNFTQVLSLLTKEQKAQIEKLGIHA